MRRGGDGCERVEVMVVVEEVALNCVFVSKQRCKCCSFFTNKAVSYCNFVVT